MCRGENKEHTMALTSDGWALLNQLDLLTAADEALRAQKDLQEAQDWAIGRTARLRKELAQPEALSVSIELVPCQPERTLALRISALSKLLGLPEDEIRNLPRVTNAYGFPGNVGESHKVTGRKLLEILREHALKASA